MSLDRLPKALARAGICSRRQAEALITAGRVRVNGRLVSHPGARLDPRTDCLALDDEVVRPLPYAYWMIHKPRGTVWPARRRHAPSEATEPSGTTALFATDRLAADVAGLLLLPNDGHLARRLAAPELPLDEAYLALVAGRPASADLRRLRRGTMLGDLRVGLASAALGGAVPGRDAWWVSLAVGDRASRRGLRRLFDAVGHPIIGLVRTGIGPLTLGDLREGGCRRLESEERRALLAALGAEDPT